MHEKMSLLNASGFLWATSTVISNRIVQGSKAMEKRSYWTYESVVSTNQVFISYAKNGAYGFSKTIELYDHEICIICVA